MRSSSRILLLLHHFSTGIIVPVLSLTLIDKGCSLAELAVVLGVYSLSAFLLEMPSGMMADLLGRKKIFIISLVLSFAATMVVLFVRGFGLLIPVAILWGAGRAFASGSLDALAIDDYIAKHGQDKIHAVASELSLLETGGLSAGAILGGFLPGIAAGLLPAIGPYDLNLIVKCGVGAVVFVLSLSLIRDIPLRSPQPLRLRQHAAESFRIVKQNNILMLLASGVFLTGLFLFAIETYWQPAFTTLLPDSSMTWLLGFLSFGCFAVAAIGNLVMRHIFLSRGRMYLGYIVTRLSMFAVLIVFALQQTAVGFGIAFLMVYLMFGGANTAESTIINTHTPNEKRASMLSLISFVFQAGALAAPFAAAFFVPWLGIQPLWLAVGCLFFAITLVSSVLLHRVVRNHKAQRAVSAANAK